VRADEEISDHTVARSSPLAVRFPRSTRFERCLLVQRGELYAKSDQRRLGVFAGTEQAGDLSPDRFTPNEMSFSDTESNCLSRAWAKSLVSTEHIKKNARVDRRDHRTSASPRSSVMTSSVDRPSFRIP